MVGHLRRGKDLQDYRFGGSIDSKISVHLHVTCKSGGVVRLKSRQAKPKLDEPRIMMTSERDSFYIIPPRRGACRDRTRTNLPGSQPRTRARPHAKPPRRGSRLARETGPAHARPHAPTVFTTSEVVTHARSATRNIARQRTSSAPSPCCGRRRRLLNKAQRALACPSSLPDASLLTTSANSPFLRALNALLRPPSCCRA